VLRVFQDIQTTMNKISRNPFGRCAIGAGAIIMLLCAPMTSCIIRAYDVDRLKSDYKTEGFLDADHFQVIVVGTPDKDKRGLVQKRESALENAKNKLSKTVIDKLSEYYLSVHLPTLGIGSAKEIANFDDVRVNLTHELMPFLNDGSVAFEYYNYDHSAVIVFRVIRRNLQRALASVVLPVVIQKK